MPAQGFLITGTDTGVGKTFVSCGIAKALGRRGRRVGPFKPAESGCEWDPQSRALIPADAVLLRHASQSLASLDTICPYRFQTAVAPAVAAQLEGCSLDPQALRQRLQDCYSSLASSHDVVLVETAGGILAPLADGFHYGDLAAELQLSVLVVAANKLGAINHTLLTLSFLKAYELNVVGCVLNDCALQRTAAVESNLQALQALVSVPLIALPNYSSAEEAWNSEAFDTLAARLLESQPG